MNDIALRVYPHLVSEAIGGPTDGIAIAIPIRSVPKPVARSVDHIPILIYPCFVSEDILGPSENISGTVATCGGTKAIAKASHLGGGGIYSEDSPYDKNRLNERQNIHGWPPSLQGSRVCRFGPLFT
jgi:hypothetical protein